MEISRLLWCAFQVAFVAEWRPYAAWLQGKLTCSDGADDEIVDVCVPNPELRRHDEKSIATSTNFYVTLGSELVDIVCTLSVSYGAVI